MGVEYSPKDLLLGLDEASSNRIGSPVDNILTYCYHYDPKTNTHSLIVARVVQLGGLLTMVLLGGFMFVMFRKDYTQGTKERRAWECRATWDRKKGERITECPTSVQYSGSFSSSG